MTKIRHCIALNVALGVLWAVALSTVALAGRESALTPEQLLANHLKSIGDPGLLAAVQSRAFVGSSSVKFIQGMNGSMIGYALYASKGNMTGLRVLYKDKDYTGEYLAYDGKEVSVGFMIDPGQKTPLGEFLYRYNRIIKNGFLGGVLSVSWPLLHAKEGQADMKCQVAKIDGRDLYELDFHPKDGFGDMKIKMYFDMETCRHVMTVYKVRVRQDVSVAAGKPQSATITTNPTTNQQQMTQYNDSDVMNTLDESYYTLTEKFGDFKPVSGMMLPHKYEIDYSLEGQGHAFIAHWDLVAKEWVVNRDLEDPIFKAQK